VGYPLSGLAAPDAWSYRESLGVSVPLTGSLRGKRCPCTDLSCWTASLAHKRHNCCIFGKRTRLTNSRCQFLHPFATLAVECRRERNRSRAQAWMDDGGCQHPVLEARR
jgi:hypothetical protein